MALVLPTYYAEWVFLIVYTINDTHQKIWKNIPQNASVLQLCFVLDGTNTPVANPIGFDVPLTANWFGSGDSKDACRTAATVSDYPFASGLAAT